MAISTVAVIGTGVIGAGWAANFLARGLDVTAWDPGQDAQAKLRAMVDNAWPAMVETGLAEGASRDRLSFADTLEQAVTDADFVQESAPEVEDLKAGLIAGIDAVAAPDVLIASSSSGLLPSRLQARCQHPGRVVIGHPFNPVYLLPLVEVLGGDQTSADSIERAMSFYRDIAKKPLHVRTEVPGYISDRLQEALWREALHMVADGSATTDELDAAITGGPGLRWAFMGTCMAFHLAGGEEGMAHMLEQFGPALELPWTRLKAPELTEDLKERMISQTRAQAGTLSVREIERLRDQTLIKVMAAVEEFHVAVATKS
jgi:carnitine 3-dehydrogenase